MEEICKKRVCKTRRETQRCYTNGYCRFWRCICFHGNRYLYKGSFSHSQTVSDIKRLKRALKKQLQFFKKIYHVQRDGGSEFKDHWQKYASKHIHSIRTARPYKKMNRNILNDLTGYLEKNVLDTLNTRKKT
jgi:hypothetical protein